MMMEFNKRLLLSVNTTAGQGTSLDNLYQMIHDLTCYGYAVTVLPIDPEKGITGSKFLKEKDDRYDVIACSGGDGTLSHLINAIMKKDIHVPIGYFPAGSTNDFASAIGLPKDLTGQCEVIGTGEPYAYDIGKFNDNYFNYIAAFGAFTEVSYATNQSLKNAIGHMAYVLNLIKAFPVSVQYHVHMEIDYDEHYLEDDFIVGTVSNTKSIGGVKTPLLDRADINDGLFDVIMIRPPKSLSDVNDILQSLTTGRLDNPLVTVFHAKHLHIKADHPVAWSLDGEDGGSHTEMDLNICPSAMRIMAPRQQDSQ